MENHVCKLHSTKKASHYCCIEKTLFCESCLKSHEGHLIYTLKEVEELKKTGVDLLKNLSNQNAKQNQANSKPAGPKIDLNALAASLDKKEEKNKAAGKTFNTQNIISNPVSASIIINNNNLSDTNNEQSNFVNKSSNFVKSNTILTPVLNDSNNNNYHNSANQVKNVNVNAGGITSFSNALNSFVNKNEDKGKEAVKEEKNIRGLVSQPILIDKKEANLKAPKNELHLVDLIIQDNKDDFKLSSNYNTYSADTANKLTNKINGNFNDQSKKYNSNNKPLETNPISKENIQEDKSKTTSEKAVVEIKQENIKSNDLPIEEKKFSVKDRLNQLNSNNKANENLTNINNNNNNNKQTLLKQEEKAKEIQEVNSVLSSNPGKVENTVSQVVHNKIETSEKTEKKAEIKIDKIKTNADIKEVIKAENSNEVKIEQTIKIEKQENLINLNPSVDNNLSNSSEKEAKTNDSQIKINLSENNFAAVPNDKNKEIIVSSKEGTANKVIHKTQIEENKNLILPISHLVNKDSNNILVNKNEQKEILQLDTNIINNNNSTKEEEKSNKIKNTIFNLQENNNNKPKAEVKLQHFNNQKPYESKITEKLNILANPVKEEKNLLRNQIKEKIDSGNASEGKNENFNKMKEMLGKRLSTVVGEKDLKHKEPEQAKQLNSNPTNVYKHTETEELKEVRKENFQKAFAGLNSCFLNRPKPKEAPSINIPEIPKQPMKIPNAPPVPNKLIPKPPQIVNAPSAVNALNLPLPPPIVFSDLSKIPNKPKNSDEILSAEVKKNIPKPPPLILLSMEKKVVKSEIKKEIVEPKKEIKFAPPEPKRVSMLDELKKKVSLRSNNLEVKEP